MTRRHPISDLRFTATTKARSLFYVIVKEQISIMKPAEEASFWPAFFLINLTSRSGPATHALAIHSFIHSFRVNVSFIPALLQPPRLRCRQSGGLHGWQWCGQSSWQSWTRSPCPRAGCWPSRWLHKTRLAWSGPAEPLHAGRALGCHSQPGWRQSLQTREEDH